MRVDWIPVLSILVLGVVCVAGNDCSVANVSQCYDTLVHYEGLGFPLYGEDEIELEETCRTMEDSFDCLKAYVASCNGHEECDEQCAELLADIGIFSLNTGLRVLQAELCDMDSPVRETYLENYVCLEDNANSYASCHNDSQLSQEFMTKITDPHDSVSARCCFFSWYQDCFVNITRDTCGVNATFFVSYSLHKLIGNIAQLMCKDTSITCDRPPLPHEGFLDDDKPDKVDDDVDNSLDGRPKASSTSVCASILCIVSSFVYMFILKHVFK